MWATFEAYDPFHLSAEWQPELKQGAPAGLASHYVMQGKEAAGVSQGLFQDRFLIAQMAKETKEFSENLWSGHEGWCKLVLAALPEMYSSFPQNQQWSCA